MNENKNSYFESSNPERCLQSLWGEKKWVGCTQYMRSCLFLFKVPWFKVYLICKEHYAIVINVLHIHLTLNPLWLILC